MSVAEAEPTAPPEPEPEPVEPTEPEPTPEPVEPEPEPTPEPPAAPPPPVVNEATMEKFYKGLATRTATLDRWIEGELGENYGDLSPCPLCVDGIVGHIYPPEWITPVSDLQARLLDVLKTPSAPEYQPAPNVRQCGTCAGWGSVLSGSKVAGKERVLCPTCKGNGFQGDLTHSPLPASADGAVEYEPPADALPLVSDDTDIWGSPRVLDDGQDNPNYGKMPQYKNPALP